MSEDDRSLCWGDRTYIALGMEVLAQCNQAIVSPLGLCTEHLQELVGEETLA